MGELSLIMPNRDTDFSKFKIWHIFIWIIINLQNL